GNKTTTTARQLVEKTKDLAKKIAEVKAGVKVKTLIGTESQPLAAKQAEKNPPAATPGRLGAPPNRIGTLVESMTPEPGGQLQSETALMQQFNAQFEHFMDDAPACDICGSITVRNGTCYKCFNCGNSMGCS
ncbi:MAG: hypothetical protein ISS79_11790, partial [Phycisphaerae bacterium]|nr:hypothetical protein [Phycisphaerae bacterium]